MANDMKRVGLIFDADGVTDFKKSLSTVNASLQENRAQFKLTKSTWDDATKSSQKLKDTNEYLSKQYEDSAKKVNVLSSELEQLENAENRNEAAISKKKAALATATSSMNYYKKGLDETNAKLISGAAKIEDYAKKLESTSKKAKDVGSSLSKNVTAPIIATGVASTMAWKQIDEAYDNIISGTGATGEALVELNDIFENVYGSMPVTSMEASNAVADLNTRFNFTGTELSKASTEFLKFAKINKTDVSTSVSLVSRAMQDAGVDTKDYSRILDALTAASQSSGISIENLTENLTKYGAPMRALGFSMEESIALFSQWEKAGVNTEIAFGGMKKAISNFSAAGKDSKVEFRKTLDEIERAPNIAEATTKAIEVFGSKAGPDLADAIQNGRFSIEELSSVVEKSGGIIEQSFNDMLDPADKADIALNNLKLAGTKLGESILASLEPILDSLISIIKNLTKWFSGLNGTMKTVIVIVGLLLAAIGPLVFIIGYIGGAISQVMLLFSKFASSAVLASGGATTLSGAITALVAPIMAVIAIVGLVIGAIVQLWTTNEQFRLSIETFISSIQELFLVFWQNILQPILISLQEMFVSIYENGIKPLWDGWVEFINTIIVNMLVLWESLKPIVQWFIEVFGPVLTAIFDSVSTVFEVVVSTMMATAGALLKNIGEVVGKVTKIFSGLIDFISGIFTGNWRTAWLGIQKIFGGVFDGFVAIAKAPLNMVIGLINGVISGVEAGINFLVKAVNKLSFDVPDWVPGIGGEKFGFDFEKVNLGRISYLAKGGELLSGMAVVAEAGPELLMQQGNKTTVTPLSNGGGATKHDLIDYDKLSLAILKAFKKLSIQIDGDKIGEIIDERLLEAM